MTQNQEKALAALLSCGTQEQAAQAAGCSTRALRRWMSDPDFSARYQAAKKQMLTDAANKARASLSFCMDELHDIASDAENPISARLTAIKTLLEYGLRLHDTCEIVERIDRL